jgi:hypothetical protein
VSEQGQDCRRLCGRAERVKGPVWAYLGVAVNTDDATFLVETAPHVVEDRGFYPRS